MYLKMHLQDVLFSHFRSHIIDELFLNAIFRKKKLSPVFQRMLRLAIFFKMRLLAIHMSNHSFRDCVSILKIMDLILITLTRVIMRTAHFMLLFEVILRIKQSYY